MYWIDGVHLDYDEAIKYFLKSANQGNVYAQFSIGIYLSYANYIIFNKYNLPGFMYENGWGVPQSHNIAIEYCFKAATQQSVVLQCIEHEDLK